MTTRRIGTLQESSLHAALKAWCAEDGDEIEAAVGGYVIDIRRDGLLVEIQTGSFPHLKHKLTALCEKHALRLVYPLTREKWIVKKNKRGRQVSRRKSPKRARAEEVFRELVYLGDLPSHPNFSLEVLHIQAEEIRVDDGRGSWRRRGWSIDDRRLIDVLDRESFSSPRDYLRLLPPILPPQFSNKDIAEKGNLPPWLAYKMSYSLRAMGAIEMVGKRGRANLFSTSL